MVITRYKNEFLKFLIYALASCDETREHLEILFETGSFGNRESFRYFLDKYDELGRKINNFIKAVDSGHMTRAQSSIQYPASSIEQCLEYKA